MLSRRYLETTTSAGLALGFIIALAVPAVVLAGPISTPAPQFNARVAGVVTDADGNPLEGVKVTITMIYQDPNRPTPPIEVTTDDEGRYFVRETRIDRARISAELEGYEYYAVEVDLRLGRNTHDIVMSPPVVPEEVLRATAANEAYSLGVAAFDAGNYEEAIRYMEQARSNIDDNEENNQALAAITQNIGNSYLALGKYEEAVVAIKDWLERSPDSPDARLALAQAYNELGDTEAAAAEVEAAMATGAEDPESHYNMGVMMIDSGDVEGGIAEIEAAVALRPDFPLAHKQLGYAYARTGEYQKAIDHFELFLEQDPDSPEAADVQQFIAALRDMIG
jgi:tetratricopeptide (TPR) repeat protein